MGIDLSYLSHLQRFLMLHASLESKAPWRSSGQCDYHFFCDHPSVCSLPLSLSGFSNLCFWCVFIQRGPQCIDPMAKNQGALAELCRAACLPACLPHRPAADFSLGPPSRPSLTCTRACAHLEPPSHGSSEREEEEEDRGKGAVCVCLH